MDDDGPPKIEAQSAPAAETTQDQLAGDDEKKHGSQLSESNALMESEGNEEADEPAPVLVAVTDLPVETDEGARSAPDSVIDQIDREEDLLADADPMTASDANMIDDSILDTIGDDDRLESTVDNLVLDSSDQQETNPIETSTAESPITTTEISNLASASIFEPISTRESIEIETETKPVEAETQQLIARVKIEEPDEVENESQFGQAPMSTIKTEIFGDDGSSSINIENGEEEEDEGGRGEQELSNENVEQENDESNDMRWENMEDEQNDEPIESQDKTNFNMEKEPTPDPIIEEDLERTVLGDAIDSLMMHWCQLLTNVSVRPPVPPPSTLDHVKEVAEVCSKHFRDACVDVTNEFTRLAVQEELEEHESNFITEEADLDEAINRQRQLITEATSSLQERVIEYKNAFPNAGKHFTT